MQIDPLAKERHVLGGFIRDPANVVLEDQHGGRRMTVWSNLLDIDHCSIRYSADLIEPGTTFALNVRRAFLFAAEEEIRSEYGSSAAREKGIETKGEHIVGVAQEQALDS